MIEAETLLDGDVDGEDDDVKRRGEKKKRNKLGTWKQFDSGAMLCINMYSGTCTYSGTSINKEYARISCFNLLLAEVPAGASTKYVSDGLLISCNAGTQQGPFN